MFMITYLHWSKSLLPICMAHTVIYLVSNTVFWNNIKMFNIHGILS